jgi:hypothetical protein
MPLARLLRKDGFIWGPEAEVAFRELQRALTMMPILQLLNFDKLFVVECDASGTGIDVVLHQAVGRSVFFSR